MDKQRQINEAMRSILVDWLVEVHMKFRLAPETLYLCVNIIDRYLGVVQVERKNLQLVGVTALLVACKYEEIYPPEVRDCVYITDRAYTRQEVLDMEQNIVSKLEFKLTVPTGYPFVNRFLKILGANQPVKFAANYYMERTLQEYKFISMRQSLVAAAAVCLAWNHAHIRQKGTSKSGVVSWSCRTRLISIATSPSNFRLYFSHRSWWPTPVFQERRLQRAPRRSQQFLVKKLSRYPSALLLP